MRQYLKSVILWLIGGWLYIGMELIWRGRSHWTMFCLGGLCFVLIGLINELIPWCMPLWQQALIGAGIITSLEFLTGCIVNLALGWHVWDYSGMPGNVLGQICLPYSLLWILVAVAAIILDDWLRYLIFAEERPHYCLDCGILATASPKDSKWIKIEMSNGEHYDVEYKDFLERKGDVHLRIRDKSGRIKEVIIFRSDDVLKKKIYSKKPDVMCQNDNA